MWALLLFTFLAIGAASFGLRLVSELTDSPALKSVLGALETLSVAAFPAIAIGIAMLRLFSRADFEWREKVNLMKVADLDEVMQGQRPLGHGVLAVRWYKASDRVKLVDLRVQAWLRYGYYSEVDGSRSSAAFALNVIQQDGSSARDRVWSESSRGTPFTAWIDLEGVLRDGELIEVQGHSIEGKKPFLYVQIRASTEGIGNDIVASKTYELTPAKDLQLGRFSPVETSRKKPWKSWEGWGQYDSVIRQAVFVYGSLLDSEALADLVPGAKPFRATVSGYKRDWSVCTDNTTIGRRTVYWEPDTKERFDGQVLFLNMETSEGTLTEGVVVEVSPDQLYRFDRREANYDRIPVTKKIDGSTSLADRHLHCVWMYVGKTEPVEQARKGLESGTAVIRREYLDGVLRGAGSWGGALAAQFETEVQALDGVPVRDLVRTVD